MPPICRQPRYQQKRLLHHLQIWQRHEHSVEDMPRHWWAHSMDVKAGQLTQQLHMELQQQTTDLSRLLAVLSAVANSQMSSSQVGCWAGKSNTGTAIWELTRVLPRNGESSYSCTFRSISAGAVAKASISALNRPSSIRGGYTSCTGPCNHKCCHCCSPRVCKGLSLQRIAHARMIASDHRLSCSICDPGQPEPAASLCCGCAMSATAVRLPQWCRPYDAPYRATAAFVGYSASVPCGVGTPQWPTYEAAAAAQPNLCRPRLPSA